MVLINPYRW